MSTKILPTKAWLASREPWTVERMLHLGLAAVAVMGWTLAYTALMRGVDPPPEVARSESARTEISANLTSLQAPNMSPSAPAAR